ncbi:MAG: N-acetylmuramoyl-L-alanine amidase [Candidatus Omnitrophota bacterium]
MKTFKIIILALMLAAFAAGCATIPSRGGLPNYSINGVSYVPLAALCESRGIKWEYDPYSKTINLAKDAHHLNLMVGERLVLVDGVAQHLRYPVDFYRGAIVVPYKFKEQVIDVLFKEQKPSRRAVAVPLTRFKKIVIDAGHGGTDPGAIGTTGVREKVLTLDIAKRLSRLLRQDGFEVVMTRTSDTFVSLNRRVDIANNSKADLFISVHVNANRVRSLSGFEVYYITPKINDAKRAFSTAQSVNPAFTRSCFAGNSAYLKAILWDMIYTYDRAESIELAGSLCRSTERELNCRILGVKSANFHVLRGARMPAVLVEVGFLSNPTEERMLKNSYYRQQIAEAVEQGVCNYVIDYPTTEVSS